METKRHPAACFIAAGLLSLFLVQCQSSDPSTTSDPAPHGAVRTYYIAADEVQWDYAPSNMDVVMRKPFDADERLYTARGLHRIGKVYRKAIYREYTDATFRTLKPRPANEQYLGILGPIIHAEVGDTIKVVFKNNATRPFSMHPHGVFYRKASEGMAYADGRPTSAEVGGAVPPGHTYTYTWDVPERAGPGPNDPSSIVWLYHSHVDEQRDVDAGLIGAIVVTRRGMARADGTPKDVDKEFVVLFNIFDENQSWYLDHNIATYTSDPKGTMQRGVLGETIPVGNSGTFSLNGTGFGDSNLKFTMNGYIFGNTPRMVMNQGDRVRWYVVAIGFGFNFHSPHWHGNTVVLNGQRTDVLSLAPAQMITVDMTPDDPGTWLFHCHVSDHMKGGMMALYQVNPAESASAVEQN